MAQGSLWTWRVFAAPRPCRPQESAAGTHWTAVECVGATIAASACKCRVRLCVPRPFWYDYTAMSPSSALPLVPCPNPFQCDHHRGCVPGLAISWAHPDRACDCCRVQRIRGSGARRRRSPLFRAGSCGWSVPALPTACYFCFLPELFLRDALLPPAAWALGFTTHLLCMIDFLR
jgi:hypothetical protein